MATIAGSSALRIQLGIEQFADLAGGWILLVEPVDGMIRASAGGLGDGLDISNDLLEGADWQQFAQWVHPDDLGVLQQALQRGLGSSSVHLLSIRMHLPPGDAGMTKVRVQVCRFAAHSPYLMLRIQRQVNAVASVSGGCVDGIRAGDPAESISVERALRRLLQLRDHEQTVVAYEIHDGIVQDVVAAKMEAEALLAALQHNRPVERESLERLVELLGQAVEDGRRLVGQLRPIVAGQQGLVDAIGVWLDQLSDRHGFRVEFDAQLANEFLSSQLESTLVRIVREAVLNAMRHSQVNRAMLRLWEADGHIYLEVRDEGIGFDPDRVPVDRYGLEGIRHRAALAGGYARVESFPGEGTTVFARLPVDC